MSSITTLGLVLSIFKEVVVSIGNILLKTRFSKPWAILAATTISAGTIIFIVALFIVPIVQDVTGLGLTDEKRRRRKNQFQSPLNRFNPTEMLMGLTSLLSVFQLIFSSFWIPFAAILAGTAVIWVPCLIIIGINILVLVSIGQIVYAYDVIHVNLLAPAWGFIMLVATLILMVLQIVFPPLLAVEKFIQSIPYRELEVVVIAVMSSIPFAIQLLMTGVFRLVEAIVMWVQAGPLTSGISLYSTFDALLDGLELVIYPLVERGCKVLMYIVGGIVKSINDPNLKLLLSTAPNLALAILQQVLIQPLGRAIGFLQSGPYSPCFISPCQVAYNGTGIVFDLYITAIDSAGAWLQNVTTVWVDIVVVGGNGTIISMVNGSQPMPTDGLKYLIGFLQSQWGRALVRGYNVVSGIQLIWQALSALQNINLVLQPDGDTTVWSFGKTYGEMIFVANSFGTFTGMFGTCDTGTTTGQIYPLTPFSQLSAILMVIADSIYVLWTLFFSLVYSFGNSFRFRTFLNTFIQTDPVWAQLHVDIVNTGVAFGCLLAYLDSHFGISLQGVVETIYWLLALPLEFIGDMGLIISGSNPMVLETVDLSGAELSLLKVAQLGDFFFRLQQGATDATCPGNIMFACNLGQGLTNVLTVIARATITTFTLGREILRTVIASIEAGSLQNLQIPQDIACDSTISVPGNAEFNDFTGSQGCKTLLAADTYAAGCQLGAAIGYFFIFNPPCMSGTQNFCSVTEFPNAGNSMLNCSATLGCKVGRIIGIFPDVIFSVMNWVISFIWTVSTGDGSDSDTFLISIFQKVLSVIVYGLLGFLCPLGHLFDCLWSYILMQGGGTKADGPASGILCLISGFLVVFGRTMGTLIFSLIRFGFLIIGLFMSMPAVTANPQQITDDITNVLAAIGKALGQLFGALLSLLVSWLFNAASWVCYNIIEPIDSTIDCSAVNATLQQVFLALGTADFNSPANQNYKRDLEDYSAGQAQFFRSTLEKEQTCVPFFQTPELQKLVYRDILKSSPPGLERICKPRSDDWMKTSPPTPRPTPADLIAEAKAIGPLGSFSVRRETSKKQDNSFDNNKFSLNTMVLTKAQKIFLQHFGFGPENVNDYPSYLATKVYWAPDSSCRLFFNRANGTKLFDLTPSDSVVMSDCIRYKHIALTIAASSQVLGAVPEDIGYNTANALGRLSAFFLRVFLIVVQYFSDRNVNPESLFGEYYQTTWKRLGLDYQHYNRSLSVHISYQNVTTSSASNITIANYTRVRSAVMNSTLEDYMKRNMPLLYIDDSEYMVFFDSNSEIVNPWFGLMDYSALISSRAASGYKIDAKELEALRNRPVERYGFRFVYNSTHHQETAKNRNGTLIVTNAHFNLTRRPTYVVYDGVYHDLDNRTHLAQVLGDDVILAMDSYQNLKLLSGIITTVFDLTGNFSTNIVSAIAQVFGGTPNPTIKGLQGINTAKRDLPGEEQNSTAPKSTYNATSYIEAIEKNRIKFNKDQARARLLFETGASGDQSKNPYSSKGLISGTFYAISEGFKVIPALVANRTKVWNQFKNDVGAVVEGLYNAPLFETHYSLLGSVVAQAAGGVHYWIGGKEPTIAPPWCVEIARKVHSITFKEAKKLVDPKQCDYYELLQKEIDSDAEKHGTPKWFNLPAANLTREEFLNRFFSKNNEGNVTSRPKTNYRSKTFFEKYVPALNADAALNRQIIPIMYDQISEELGRFAYLYFGQDGTAVDRMARIILNVQPKWEDEWSKYSSYEEAMEKLSDKRQQELRSKGYIRHDDHDFWTSMKETSAIKTFYNIKDRLKDASAVFNAISDAKVQFGRKRWGNSVAEYRQFQNEYYDLKQGFLFEEIIQRATDMSKELTYGRGGKGGRSLLSDQGLIWNQTRFNQLDLYDDFLSFYLNFTDLFNEYCFTNQIWLCQSCLAVDGALNRIEELISVVTFWYTNDLPPYLTNQVQILTYSGEVMQRNLTNPAVQIGLNRTSQPRFPNLGENVGYMLQFLDFEIENGVDFFAWLWPILGEKITDWVPVGPCHDLLNNFTQSANPTSDPNFSMGTWMLAVVEYDMEIPICNVSDTVYHVATAYIPNVGTYFLNHIFLCNYGNHLDGSARNMSMLWGAFVVAVLYLVVSLILSFIPGISPIILLVWTTYPIAFIILVYNGNMFCLPLFPMPIVNDLLSLIAYTPLFVGPCSIGIGTFVADDSYQATNCILNSPNNRTYVNGYQLGFTNPRNVIAFAELAYNISWDVLDYAKDMMGVFYGTDAPTYDYSDYFTNPIRHANYTGLFIVSLPGAIAMALLALILGIALSAALFSVYIPVGQFVFMLMFSTIKTIEKMADVR